MCGIIGMLQSVPVTDEGRYQAMVQSVAHRGPDHHGSWRNDDGTVLLSHHRLSIIDPCERSNQPMRRGKNVIIYNGEIYNYLELREQLTSLGQNFTTTSDTEVILASYETYGSSCVDFLEGMFAFGIWDEEKELLFCARDRFGEKPFYFSHDKSRREFLFASEMKGLLASGISRQVNHSHLLYFLSEGITRLSDDPLETFYKGVFQLPPAHTLIYNTRTGSLNIKRYWECDIAVHPISEIDAEKKLGELLEHSIRMRLRSDVPVGTSLSGGLDSSTIASHLSDMAPNYQSFSAVFPGFEKDESDYISLVSRKFQLQSIVTRPTASEFADDLEYLIYLHEQPISDPSCYAQYRVFKTAREHGVKVLIDGQGADELFAGYSKYYHWYLQELLRSGRFAEMQRQKKYLAENEQSLNWGLQNWIAAAFPALTSKRLADRVNRKAADCIFLNAEFVNTNLDRKSIIKPQVRTLNDILNHDTFQYGLSELLRYADRNSMANGCEVRLPFLSRQLAEFAFSLPSHLKIDNGYGKWILRKHAEGRVPEKIVQRKKKVGFEVPVEQWMNNPRVFEMTMASVDNLHQQRIINKNKIAKLPQEDPLVSWRLLVAGRLL